MGCDIRSAQCTVESGDPGDGSYHAFGITSIVPEEAGPGGHRESCCGDNRIGEDSVGVEVHGVGSISPSIGDMSIDGRRVGSESVVSHSSSGEAKLTGVIPLLIAKAIGIIGCGNGKESVLSTANWISRDNELEGGIAANRSEIEVNVVGAIQSWAHCGGSVGEA